MFVALQAAGLTLTPSKLAFGPKSDVITAEGASVGEDRIKAIQKLPKPPPASKISVPFWV